MTDTAVLQDDAFRKLLLEAVPHLRAYARSLARNIDLADDLVQETVVKALGAASQFAPGTSFRAWVFTILRHQYLNESRKWRNRVAPLEDDRDYDLGSSPSQHAHLDFLDFRRAFWQLPPDQREALILVGASGVSYEEAADICTCPVGTIKSRVSRARAELKRILETDSVLFPRATLSNEEADRLFAMPKKLARD